MAPETNSHPFSAHDMLAMERIGGPASSPDGQWVVFNKRVTDLEANKGRNNLWLVSADGGQLRRLTTHESGSSDPVWSPDGRFVYFLSGRRGSSQVWRILLDGGEAVQITDEPLDVNSLIVAPNGGHIAYSMDVFPGVSPADSKKQLDEQGERKATGKLHDKLFFRHWDTWKDGTRSHVFVLAVSDDMPASRHAGIDIMKTMEVDVPSKPFGEAEEYTFTPDSKAIVFSAGDAGRQESWSTQHNLYLAPIGGDQAPKCITSGNQAWLTNPVFSPDGKKLAYLGMKRPGFEADRWYIHLRDWPSGQPRILAESWDRSAVGIEWSKDGQTIYTAADNIGQHSLFAIDVQSEQVKSVVEHGKVSGVTALAGGGVVFGRCHLRSPVELFAINGGGRAPRQITHINQEKIAAARMGEPEQFSFKGWNDEEVYAYVVKPVDFEAGKKYPVAFLIHGGPQGSFGNDFHYRWNPQAYAGAGYAVVMVDFHGSTGYGQAFTDSISRHWGDRPFEDLQKGLAAAMDRCSWMDSERVAALGASYGGYMINWIAGNWPDRFKCLVNHDGNIDERMAYFETEELWFPEWERGGTPWDVPENYSHHNPLDHVDKWKTPMLVIHGGKDYRVVATQGMATFTCLQRRGIPSKFLYFDDENHWVLKPANSVQWHETVIAWLDEWCTG